MDLKKDVRRGNKKQANSKEDARDLNVGVSPPSCGIIVQSSFCDPHPLNFYSNLMTLCFGIGQELILD